MGADEVKALLEPLVARCRSDTPAAVAELSGVDFCARAKQALADVRIDCEVQAPRRSLCSRKSSTHNAQAIADTL